MGNVGLLLIGAVLLVNGLGLLGRLGHSSAAPLNFFVGGAQVLLPTLGLVLEHGDPTAPARYAPVFLFGFTYLWVAIDTVRADSGRAFGFFSGFVAVIALVEAVLSLRVDPAFSASWFLWALMWGGFFVLQGLGRERFAGAPTRAVLGWLLIIGGQLSATLPGLLRMEGAWPSQQGWFAALVCGAATLGVALAWILGQSRMGYTLPDAAAVSPDRNLTTAAGGPAAAPGHGSSSGIESQAGKRP